MSLPNQIKETLSRQPGKPLRRALQVWFSPQDLLDLAAIVSVALESPTIQRKLKKEYGISEGQLAELGVKMTKEVERV
jgi:hypothetical protein